MAKLRYTLPLIPIRGIIMFPGMLLHFDVSRPKSISAVEEALSDGKLIYLCYQTDYVVDDPKLKDLAQTGVICEVKQVLRLPGGSVRILAEGLYRAQAVGYEDLGTYAQVSLVRIDDVFGKNPTYTNILLRRLQHLTEEYLDLYGKISSEAITALMSIESAAEIADVLASNIQIKLNLKQEILDCADVDLRIEKLIAILTEEIELLDIERDVMEKLHEDDGEQHREHLLREKIRILKEELGEDDDDDERKYRDEISTRDLPLSVKEKLEKEILHLRKISEHSAEYALIDTYIQTILSLPWDRSTEESLDIEKARAKLDKDHYGLKDVKERVLEYIAVRKLTDKPNGNILCLAGPPGTGKTSIVKSMAESIGRKYFRISLGGIHSEAEVRGHRKTYIGAMPGRIIDAIKQCGTSNPVILLDEIDKMTCDASGDPTSAMLEVLDPEQNNSFRDNYIELPFDLSNTIFIASANNIENIPRPLLDRMDVVEVSGYTENEKLVIAKNYLLKKQRNKTGVKGKNLRFTESGLKEIIDGYTRESGVRSLERTIAKVCRKAAVEIVNDENYRATVKSDTVKDFLGKRIYNISKTEKSDPIGCATGLAWTETGGETLCIEVGIMDGSGKLELTGNLGDVMKESAKAGYTYIRSNAAKLGIDTEFHKNCDIHIHIPEGAIPKDGPSAGITMTLAMISALADAPVRHDTAMTGEITLRGNVLPIGGLKEKTLAALRIGIKNVIIPYENKPDHDELPNIVKENMNFVYAKTMDDVIDFALTKKNKLPIFSIKEKSVIHDDSIKPMIIDNTIPTDVNVPPSVRV